MGTIDFLNRRKKQLPQFGNTLTSLTYAQGIHASQMPLSFPPAEKFWIDRETLRPTLLLVLTAIAFYLCYLLLLPFLRAIGWALTLAIVAWPLYQFVDKKLKRPSLASGISVLLVAIILVLPMVLITRQLVTEATDAVNAIRSPETRQQWAEYFQSKPQLVRAVSWIQTRVDVPRQIQNMAEKAGTIVQSVFSGSAAGLTQLVIALFTLFFLFRDHDYFLSQLRYLIPLTDAEADRVFTMVRTTINAGVRGRILIALIQGMLGGLMFWILAVPGALLWGSAMALLSMVPMLGSFVVWIPASIFLAIAGHPTKALVLAIWGALVIGTVDNLLYPLLVGRDLKFHTLTIFFSVVGGIAVFGPLGLVMGPVIVGITDALIQIWARRTVVNETLDVHPTVS